MEEIGIQVEARQPEVVDAVRRYVCAGGRRLIEECPLREELSLLRAKPVPEDASFRKSAPGTGRIPRLAALFENYFDYFFRHEPRRALLVGPTVGRWTGILYDEKAIDVDLLRWVSAELGCRAVGFCFIEREEYSYIELYAGRETEIFSSFLTDEDGRNFWSARNEPPPEQDRWIRTGFLKNRYNFIPGFYDLGFLKGKKSTFECYRYTAFPVGYDEKDNYPLSTFRYLYYRTPADTSRAPGPDVP